MRYALFIVALMLALPGAASAQTATTTVATSTTALEVSGWIPYWRVTEGTRDARKQLDTIDILHPFAFSVQPDGKIKDLAGLSKYSWTRLFREARANGTLVIPTIMWSDTNAIHEILSDPKTRTTHVKRIVNLVKNGRYDGIDIDYEGKKADTKDVYSTFLGELSVALGDKVLSCTIEARTPPESLYPAGKIPDPLQYANDYVKINEYCDRVNVMAYDQQRADLALNNARIGAPYYPVSDIDWVRKVMTLALKDISADKLVLSVPTYGRGLEVTVAPDWYKAYKQLWSVSEEYAFDTAEEYGVTPARNSAGELSFSYVPEGSAFEGLFTDAATALAYANSTGKTVTVNFVSWSDAEAVAQKVALARELGLRGIAIFKIDGGEDPAIWELF
jgi:spore germination protein